jgi:hypothetical protein
VRARHRYLGFAAEGPASDALSPPRSLGGVARPGAFLEALRLGARRAKRRLSTSATNPRSASTTDGSSEPRAPRPRSPANEAVFRAAPPRGMSGRIAGGHASRHGQPRRHGPGAGPKDDRPSWTRLLPSRSLAAGALPQPDRLGHLMSRTRGDAGWSSRRRRAFEVIRGPLTSSPSAHRLAVRAFVGPLHPIPREEDRDRLHPRCLPSPDHP